jgi:anti-sigma factor RsiW
MPSCGDVLELQEYVDGELEAPRAQAVVAHLAACERCRRLVANLQAVSAPLREAEAPLAPTGLPDRIFAAVAGLPALPALACDEALEALSLAHDGRLDHTMAQRLEAHLSACDSCHRAARQVGILVAALRDVEPEPVPAELLPRLKVAVAAAAPRRQSQPVLWRRWAMGAAGLAAAAAILFAVMSQVPTVVRTPSNATVAVAPVAPAPVVSAAPAPAPVTIGGQTARATAFRGTATPTTPSAVARGHRSAVPGQPAAPLAPAEAPAPPPAPEPPPLMVASLPPPGASHPVEVAVSRDSVASAPALTRTVAKPDARASVERLSPKSVGEPTPVMIASLPKHKTMPAAVSLAPAAAEAQQPRKTWVSRPPMDDEREVALADDRSERLALAKAEINDAAREIARAQPRVWTID